MQIQISFLSLMNAVILFWSLAYPFNYKRAKALGRMHYIHIVIVLIALIMPLLTALVHLRDGFISIDYPTSFCYGRNSYLTFFFLTLPTSLVLCSCSVLMVLIFWLIFKVNKLVSKSPRSTTSRTYNVGMNHACLDQELIKSCFDSVLPTYFLVCKVIDHGNLDGNTVKSLAKNFKKNMRGPHLGVSTPLCQTYRPTALQLYNISKML